MELDAEVAAGLTAAITSNTSALAAAERRKRDLAAAVSYFAAPAFGFGSGAAVIAPADNGPKDGFTWAVQHVAISGLGATTDFMNVYRGASVTDVEGQNAQHTIQIPIAGAIGDWHPGRTGLLLRGANKERLIVTGTFTGTAGIVSYDVIQVTDAQLPYFLL
jgi:hypothetical protein